jgi:hypothetical protein
MYKEILFARSSPSLSRRECYEYVHTRHSPLGMSCQAIRDILRRYIVSYVLLSEECPVPTPYRRETDIAIIVDHSFESRDAWLTAMQDADYLQRVRPDEVYMTHEVVGGLPDSYDVAEHVVFSDGVPVQTGEHRLLNFLKRRSDVDPASFMRALEDHAEAVATEPAFRKIVRKLVHNTVNHVASVYETTGVVSGGTDGDAIVEMWVDDPAALPAVQNFLGITQDVVDVDGSFSIIAQQTVIIP